MMLRPWIVKTIKDAAKEELNGKDEKLLGQIWDWINLVLQKWKLEHGDRNPMKGDGLLLPNIEIPFEDAEPWECAGWIFPSRIALALKLLREEYPDFMKILDKTNIRIVLASLIDHEPESYGNDDIFFAYDMLVKLQASKHGSLATLLSNWDTIQAGERQKQNLAMGNPAASKNKSERASKYHEDWKLWARQTWSQHPYWEVGKVAEHVLQIATQQRHKMANGKPYKVGSILKIITGVKQSLKTEK